MELNVHNIKGEDTGRKVKLDDSVFNITPNDHAIYLDVKQYRANNQQGTHKAKERNEITGSRKKIKRQKGTGTARAGDIKNPIYRGGGRMFGPRPRNHGFKLNKKVKALARRSALSHKTREKAVTVLESFDLDQPKTREYRQFLEKFSSDNHKSLLVLPEKKDNIFLSSRNLRKAKVVSVDELVTYDVINAEKVFLVEGVEEELQKTLNR